MPDIEITETFQLLSMADHRDPQTNQIVDRRLDNARVLKDMNSEPMIDEIFRRITESEECIRSMNATLEALLELLKLRREKK